MSEASKVDTIPEARSSPEPEPEPARELEPGQTLGGKYLVERVVARGGIGIVVAARHKQLDRRVAIKYLQRRHLDSVPLVERFTREAQLSSKIRSQHVVRVHDVATDETIGPYMVMEYLEGEDLDKVLDRGPLNATTAVDYLVQACDALAEAHALGIVHRDLKPGNLFLAELAGGSSVVKIIDFGISKAAPKRGEAGAWMYVTTGSEIFGSPVYMSPEQLRSAASVDARADIWALGVVLFELVTGSLPFDGDGLPQLCTSIVTDDPRSMQQLCPAAPAELEAVVIKCLQKDPAQRYRNVGELVQDLERFVSGGSSERIEHIKRVVREVGSIRPPTPIPGSLTVSQVNEALDALRRASEPPPSLKVPETPGGVTRAPWEPPVLLEDISPPTAARMGQARIAAGVGLLLAIVIGVLVLVTRGSASSMSAPSTAASPMPESLAIPTLPVSTGPLDTPKPPATGTPTASENGSTAVAAPSASTGSAAVPIALRPTPSSSAPVPGARAPGPAPKPSPRPVDDYSQFGERR